MNIGVIGTGDIGAVIVKKSDTPAERVAW